MIEIIVPLFNEEENVAELHARLLAACNRLDAAWQVTFVDDGSADRTVAAIEECRGDDGRFRVLQLSRNFGHQAAITAGLAQAEGDAVVLLDGDLQDPPELIPALATAWRDGAEVVIARRRSRQETGLRRLAFDLFHAGFRYLADADIPPHTGTFCLLARPALDALNALPEAHRFFPGLRAWVGFRSVLIDYDRQSRHRGSPKQTFPRLVRYAADGVLSFSFRPLRLLTLTGLVVCGLAFLVAAWFVAKRLVGLETAPLGFTTLCCAVFGLGGLQLIGMGVLGEYVGRIFEEAKRRPLYVVRRDAVTDAATASPARRAA
jgi:glycosyltransferase involved in cell wall biosynthesis